MTVEHLIRVDMEKYGTQWERLRDHVKKMKGTAFVSDEEVLELLLELEHFDPVSDADFGTR